MSDLKQAAEERYSKQNPECPNCQSRGAWEFSEPELILGRTDGSGKVVELDKQVVGIKCASCGTEMPDFEGD